MSKRTLVALLVLVLVVLSDAFEPQLINETRRPITETTFDLYTAVNGKLAAADADSDIFAALKKVKSNRLIDFGLYDEQALVLKPCWKTRQVAEIYRFPDLNRIAKLDNATTHKIYSRLPSLRDEFDRHLTDCILASATCHNHAHTYLDCDFKRIRRLKVNQLIATCFWSNVTNVILSNNAIKWISGRSTFFKRYPLIVRLDLSGNRLKAIELAVFTSALKSLRVLTLTAPVTSTMLRPYPYQSTAGSDENAVVAAAIADQSHLKVITIANDSFELMLRRECLVSWPHHYHIRIVYYDDNVVFDGFLKYPVETSAVPPPSPPPPPPSNTIYPDDYDLDYSVETSAAPPPNITYPDDYEDNTDTDNENPSTTTTYSLLVIVAVAVAVSYLIAKVIC